MNQADIGLIRLFGDSEAIKKYCALLDNVPSVSWQRLRSMSIILMLLMKND